MISDLTVYNGELYAGGSFVTMNGINCYNIAKYNGFEWSTAGTGARGQIVLLFGVCSRHESLQRRAVCGSDCSPQ